MTQGEVAQVITEAVLTILIVALPMLGLGLVVGLFISVVQATTQINEQTIVFVAKIVCVFLALILFGRWMLTRLTDFTTSLFEMIVRSGV
ncbi:MAG: flagellar biosynthesis protein FliQ [Oscillospiraceae bacterium]|nr:flagellar biosynthesis protein FliQ [Oscillospiraceae bacterium]